MENVGAAELLWTLAALLGFGFRVRGLLAAVRDYHVARELDAGEGIRLLSAGQIRDELAHLFVLAGFATIGVYAMHQPNPPHLTVGEIMLTVVFVGSVAILAANSALEDRERAELRRYIRRHPHDS